MTWVVVSATPGANYGNEGFVEWTKPVPDAHGPTRIPIPDDLKVIDMRASWASDGVNAYNCGGFTQNAVLTKDMALHALTIRAPTFEPTVALVAGPGITANVICYLRFYDRLSGERSPLSAPSATLAAANQQVEYDDLDLLEPPPRATDIEAWESRDGGLPRFVFRRQIGVVTVTHGLALGDLGEAETSDWTRPPRCRFATFWHERLVMAGDDADPTAIYFMDIGFPERWAGLSLRTKSRQPVVGIAEINDRLLIFCPFATEIVSGWTEDDLRINIIQPQLGLLTHHGLMQTDGWLWVPTHEQPYITDGSSWFPMGLDVKKKWAEDVKAFRLEFQSMFAEHRPDEHVIRWYVGQGSSDNGALYCYWVADYETAIPLEGGGLGQPRWAYDSQEWPAKCSALFAVPGGRRREPYIGSETPAVAGQGGSVIRVGTGTIGDLFEGNDLELVTGALQFGSLGGSNAMGLRLQELSVLLRSEATSWTLEVYAGDIECYAPPSAATGFLPIPPAWTKVVSASAVAGLEPKWTHTFGDLPQISGRAFIIRIVVDPPADAVRFAGLVALWLRAPYDRRAGRVVNPGH